MSRAKWILMGLVACLVQTKGEICAGLEADVRVIEGMVVSRERMPIPHARVLFGAAEAGMAFVDEAAARTDEAGRYRIDLGRFPWSKGAVRVLVLAPGFDLGDRTIEPRDATADFELLTRPWKEVTIRVESDAGRPAGGTEVDVAVGKVAWARLKTDAVGMCRIAMAPELWWTLLSRPAGCRAVTAQVVVTEEGPSSIKLPVIPPIRGRVLDAQGRPVHGVTVGRWIASSDGEHEMVPFFDGSLATTDNQGAFEIAPEVNLSLSNADPPKGRRIRWLLCFADTGFRRVAYRFFDPVGATSSMVVTLEPARRVRIPITRQDVTPNFIKGAYDWIIYAVPRPDAPHDVHILSNGLGGHETRSDRVVIEEYLPAGTYQVQARLRGGAEGQLVAEGKRDLVVPQGEGELEVTPLVLGPLVHQQMVGKTAPEIDAADLDTGRMVKLADFLGKVVILDFWGYWCGPCIGSMPHLVELQRSFAGRPLEIIAIHDQSVQSRSDYDRRMAASRRLFWGGHDLPFRVLLDRPNPEDPGDVVPQGNGMTVRRYHIQSFPTLLVIGPDGTIVEKVKHTDYERLVSVVRELLQKAEAK